MGTITYTDVSAEKTSFTGSDLVVIQDAVSPGAPAETKYNAMKKATLSPLRLFMQSGLSVELSVTNGSLKLILKDTAGNVLSEKSVELTAGITDVEVDGSSVVENGVAKVIGKYSKPAGGIPKSDLDSGVKSSLEKADTALQAHQDISGKQNTLASGTNIKTINNESILGRGNIEIKTSGGIQLKGEKTGEELDALTVSDVESGWTYMCTSSYGLFEANKLYSAVVESAVLSWVKLSFIDLSNYVEKSRKVNGHTLESDVEINTTDIPDFVVMIATEAESILNA